MFKFCGWDATGGGGVQGFRLKSRDFGQPVQGSALSRLASMQYLVCWAVEGGSMD